MTSLNLCPQEIDICVTRGDTSPWTFTVTSGGSPVDITGWAYSLTVDPSSAPTDALNNLFALTGTLTTPLSGIVSFEMSAVQADQTPKTYYFDLQQTDGSGKLRTIAKGAFTFKQDITK